MTSVWRSHADADSCARLEWCRLMRGPSCGLALMSAIILASAQLISWNGMWKGSSSVVPFWKASMRTIRYDAMRGGLCQVGAV